MAAGRYLRSATTGYTVETPMDRPSCGLYETREPALWQGLPWPCPDEWSSTLAQPLVSGEGADDATLDRGTGRIAAYQLELEELKQSLTLMHARQAELQDVLAAYQARVEATPTRQTELIELMRGYGTYQKTYGDLLAKSQEAEIALNLERRQIGEQFRVLDAPRLPVRPFSPDRQRLTMMAALFGFGLGVGLVALLEYRDTSLRTRDDVVAGLSLPVLAVVPRMRSEREKSRRRVIRWTTRSATVVLLLGLLVAGWRLGLLGGLVQ